MLPDPEKNLLSHIFRLSRITQHSPGETHHPRQVPTHEFSRGALVALAYPPNQIFVRVTHDAEPVSKDASAEPSGARPSFVKLREAVNPAWAQAIFDL
jgi:hypothetical protein